MSVGLGLGLVFVRLFRFSILCFSGSAWTILFSCCLCCCVRFSIFNLHKEIGWEERLRNNLFFFVSSAT